jgi:pyruvate/2-oxoglutarate dehydrogenase complex dihydrolipoamide acyltransferase (E2) component
MNVESIRKLNKQAEESKNFQDMMVSKMEAITSRLSKVRDQFQDELKNARNELTLKIEETDKFFNEQVEILQASIERNKVMAKEQLTRAKEDF